MFFDANGCCGLVVVPTQAFPPVPQVTPSPKSQTQLTMVEELVDCIESKNTVCPTNGSDGENVKSATICDEVDDTVTDCATGKLCCPASSLTIKVTV